MLPLPADEQGGGVRRQGRVPVEGAVRLEGLHLLQDRVALGAVGHGHPGHGPRAEVPLVVAAEDLRVELQPVLEGVAGRAQADHGPAVPAVAPEAFQLGAVRQQPAREEHHGVGALQRLEGDLVVLAPEDQQLAGPARVGQQVVPQDDQGLLRVVLEGARDQQQAGLAHGWISMARGSVGRSRRRGRWFRGIRSRAATHSRRHRSKSVSSDAGQARLRAMKAG